MLIAANLPWTVSGFSDDSLSLDLVAKIEVKASNIYVDNLNNLYILSSDNRLLKYDNKGGKLDDFSENIYGGISFVDVSNPLNLLLFYRDFATILVLNNDFQELGIHQLQYMGFQDITAIGFSKDNQFWIYDNSDKRLKKIGYDSYVNAKSDDLFSLGLISGIPDFILDRNRWVYMNDPESGILVFDIFGEYSKTIPIKGLKDFQIAEDILIYYQNNRLHTQHLSNFGYQSFSLPEMDGILNVRFQNGLVFIHTGNAVSIFKVNP